VRELEKGDIVEVRRSLAGSRDLWVSARIVGLSHLMLEVQALGGTFDGEHDRIALRRDHVGRTWRETWR
jgi:hypothetical protein